jgi:hypothetical protein
MPAESFADSFDRADNTDLGPDWDPTSIGGAQIVGGRLRATTISTNAEESTSGFSGARCFARIKIKTFSGASLGVVAVLLRVAAPTTRTFYAFQAYKNNAGAKSIIAKWVTGTLTEIVTENTISWAVGDVLEGWADGSVLMLFRNGSLILTTTDTDITTGRAGVQLFEGAAGNLANTEADEFAAGPLLFPDVVVLDNFDRADENPLTSTNYLSGHVNGNLKVVSNLCEGATDTDPLQLWKTPFRGKSQHYMTVSTKGSVTSAGQAVLYACCTPDLYNGYSLYYDTSGALITLRPLVAGAFGSNILSTAVTQTDGDAFGMEIGKNWVVTYFKPVGSTWRAIASAIDTQYRGGYAGLGCRRTVASGGPKLNDLGIGNMTRPALIRGA